MPGVYYPLKPTGKRYTPKRYKSIFVSLGSEGEFKAGAITGPGPEGDLITFETTEPGPLINEIARSDPETWFIGYGIDWFPSVIREALTKFSRVTGIGDKSIYLQFHKRVKGKVVKWFLVDCQSYYAHGLGVTCKTLGIPVPTLAEGETLIDWLDYARSGSLAIYDVWTGLVNYLRDNYNVFPSKSPGATALKLFQTGLDKENPLKPRSKRVRGVTQYSIKAGALHWKPGIYNDAYMYDLNASYPYVMRLITFPRYSATFAGHPPPSPFWIATVRLSYTCNTDFSPAHIPTVEGSHWPVKRIDNTVMSLNYIDFETWGRLGTLTIHEWIEGVCWRANQAEGIFKEWSKKVEGLSATPAGKLYMKIISRALHSKFAQSAGAEIVTIRRIKAKRINHTRGLKDIYPLGDGLLAVKVVKRSKPKFKPYSMPEYESLTLAMGRLLVYSAMDDHTIYIDTDCIISTVPRPDLVIGGAFGQWKLSHSGACAIAGPRMYAFEHDVKVSGIYTPDRDSLREAIWSAATGKIRVLNAIERAAMLTVEGANTRDRDHTIKQINYPLVEVRDGIAYVTRSPTKEYKIRKLKNILT